MEKGGIDLCIKDAFVQLDIADLFIPDIVNSRCDHSIPFLKLKEK